MTTDDDDTDYSVKPIVVDDVLKHIEYKFLPNRLREMLISELVYCTDPLTRVFPGCTATMDSTVGRREAFWLAMCRCILINQAKISHTEIHETIPERGDTPPHVQIFKKQHLTDYQYAVDSLVALAGELGNFSSEGHQLLLKALKIGGKQPFVVPVDMALENCTATAKAAKTMLMLTLPFRLIPEVLGITPPAASADEEDEEDEGDGSDDDEAKRCNPMFVFDSTVPKSYKELKKEFKTLRAVYEDDEDAVEMRCIVVTSPPWGVLDGNRTEAGGEDEALTGDQILTLALGLAEVLDELAVVCLHLPPYDQAHWRRQFETTGKWEAYLHPVVLVASSTKGLTFFNKYQHANNVFSFLCLHHTDKHPPVTSDFLRDKAGMAKLMNALWNTGTIVQSAAVPKAERLTAKVEKQITYMRTQQLPAAVLRPLIRMFGRALSEQPAVVIVDPFMGCGSTALAARQLGCSFIGWDRDHTIVTLARDKVDALQEVSPVPYNVWSCTHQNIFLAIFTKPTHTLYESST